MKKILGIILCVMTLHGYSQITPVRLVRVANDRTVFTENIAKGTMVYDVDAAVLRIAFKSIPGTNAIRDVEASFYIISTGQYWDKTLGHLYSSTITDSIGIGTASPSELFEINGGKFSLNGTTDFYENTSGKSQIDGGSIVLNLDSVYVENDLSFASQSVFVDSILNTVINSDGALITASAVVDYVGTVSDTSLWDRSGGSVYTKTVTDSIGIGTASPKAQLDIVGRIEVHGTGGGVFIGDSAGYRDDWSDNYNTFVGYRAGRITITGANNTAIGANALMENTTNYNTAIGSNALRFNQAAQNNTAIGYSALRGNFTGPGNTAIGSAALLSNTEGIQNIAIGYLALDDNTTGDYNIAISAALGANVGGDSNIGIGSGSLNTNVSGDYNTGIGYLSLSATTTDESTGVGYRSLQYSTGLNNTGVGSYSMQQLTTGVGNVAIGKSAGLGFVGSAVLTTASNSTFIGYNTKAFADDQTNQTVIGANAIGNGVNTVTLGDDNVISVMMAEDSSATVYAGGFVTTGDIRTTQYISPDKAIHLFHYYGDSTVSYSYSTEWDHLSNIGDSLWINDHSDGFTESNDTITITGAGHYDFIATNTLSCDYNETVSIRFYNKTQTSGMPVAGAITGEGTDDYGTIITVASFVCAAGDEILLQIKGDGSGTAQLKNGIIKITKVHN